MTVGNARLKDVFVVFRSIAVRYAFETRSTSQQRAAAEFYSEQSPFNNFPPLKLNDFSLDRVTTSP